MIIVYHSLSTLSFIQYYMWDSFHQLGLGRCSQGLYVGGGSVEVTLSECWEPFTVFEVLLFHTDVRVAGGYLHQAGWVHCHFLLLLLLAMDACVGSEGMSHLGLQQHNMCRPQGGLSGVSH